MFLIHSTVIKIGNRSFHFDVYLKDMYLIFDVYIVIYAKVQKCVHSKTTFHYLKRTT